MIITFDEALDLIHSRERRHYVYVLRRPDTKEPFYVGKGSWSKKRMGTRIANQVMGAKKNTRHPKYAIIASYQKLGLEPLVEIDSFFEYDDVKDAYAREKQLIEIYGRRDLNTGTLANRCSGGRGIPNLTPETRKRIGDAHRGKKLSPEHVAAILKGRRHYRPTDETKSKIAESNRGQKRTDETRAKQSAIAKLNAEKRWAARREKYGPTGFPHREWTPEQRARRSELTTAQWEKRRPKRQVS